MKVVIFAAALFAPSLAAERPDQPTGAGTGETSLFAEAPTEEVEWEREDDEELQEEEEKRPFRSYKQNLLQQRLRTSASAAAEMSETDRTLMQKGRRRRRRAPPPTPWPTPWPTPYPTPVPTPFPTPTPTPPTPYPTPYPTEAAARMWVSAAPTPAPTRWHQAPGAEVSGPAQYLLPVRDALEDQLQNLERLLESGAGDDRLGFCDDTYTKMDETKAKHAYVDKDPHAWAMTEVNNELDWLCKDWTPEKHKYLPSHMEAIKQVLATYEERITCHPGDVACNQGHVVGKKPNCACKCNAGWAGESCHERAAALVSTGHFAAREIHRTPLAGVRPAMETSAKDVPFAKTASFLSPTSETTARAPPS